MQKTINMKFAALIAGFGLALCVALPALAYDNLEIEIDIYDDGSLVEVSYEEDGEDVVEEFEFDSTDEDEIYTLLAAELDMSADDVEDFSEVSQEDGSVDDADGDMEDAQDAIDDAQDAIDEVQAYIDGLDEEEASSTIASLEDDLEIAQGYLDDAQEAFDAEDYGDAEDFANQAEDEADSILEDMDDDGDDEGDDEEGEEEENDDDSDFCDRTQQAAGWGVAKKCVDNDDWEVNDKLENKVDRFADFGKSTDREVLQSQLRELLELLIQLLQAQMAAQS